MADKPSRKPKLPPLDPCPRAGPHDGRTRAGGRNQGQGLTESIHGCRAQLAVDCRGEALYSMSPKPSRWLLQIQGFGLCLDEIPNPSPSTMIGRFPTAIAQASRELEVSIRFRFQRRRSAVANSSTSLRKYSRTAGKPAGPAEKAAPDLPSPAILGQSVSGQYC